MAIRRYNFFERDVLKEPGHNVPLLKIQAMDVSSATAGHGLLIVGDGDGGVSLVEESLRVSRFRAHLQRVNHVATLPRQPVLVTLGDAMEHRTGAQIAMSREVAKGARAAIKSVLGEEVEEEMGAAQGQPSASVRLWRLDKTQVSGACSSGARARARVLTGVCRAGGLGGPRVRELVHRVPVRR